MQESDHPRDPALPDPALPDPALLFVYGTLKRGHCRAPMLVRQRFLGTVQSRPIYRLFKCGTYPGLIRAGDDDGITVEGELWEVDRDCLAWLDNEEGLEEGLYERVPIEIEGPYENVEGYLYLGETESLTDCGGCWTLEFERQP